MKQTPILAFIFFFSVAVALYFISINIKMPYPWNNILSIIGLLSLIVALVICVVVGTEIMKQRKRDLKSGQSTQAISNGKSTTGYL